VEGVSLGDDETLMLDHGEPIEADLNIHNPYRITGKQRRKIFALVNDIEAHTGQPSEYMRGMFQWYYEMIYGLDEPISLANCNKRVASQLIDIILAWVFIHDVPLNHKTSDLMKNDRDFLYWSTVNRTCVICGTKNADLAHRYAIGRGMDRRAMDHYGNEVLALCRKHHTEQHQIGIGSFNNKYHLVNSWVKVDERLNKKLKGQ
jgi:hypothetical protein